MPRQVLTIPDIPAPFLTETEGDARYAPLSGGGYLTEAAGDARYVNTTGDTLTGPLAFQHDDIATDGALAVMAKIVTPAANVAALSFNGTSDYAETPHSADLEILGSWTLEFWLRVPGGWNAADTIVCGKSQNDFGSANLVFGFGFNVVIAGFQNSFVSHTVTYNAATAGVSTGWNHWAAVFNDTANTITLYLNGTQVAQATGVTAAPAANGHPFTVGKRYNGSLHFAGQLDELRVWSVARTGTEVGAYWQTRAAGSETGLVACYHLDENSGATAFDIAPPAQNLTLSGATWYSTSLPTLTDIGGGIWTTASTGAIRLPAEGAGTIAWRNAANTADLPLAVDASDQLTFNGVALGGGGGAFLPLAGGVLTGDVALDGADLTDRYIEWRTAGAARWRLGIIDSQAEGTPDVGGDLVLRWFWNDGTTNELLRFDRDLAYAIFQSRTPGATALAAQTVGDAQPRLIARGNGYLYWGDGAAVPDTYVTRVGAGLLFTNATLHPDQNNAFDLGANGLRWRKVWGVDAEFTNVPTVGGTSLDSRYATPASVTSAITTHEGAGNPHAQYNTQAEGDARYLQLAGGTVTGVLTISNATPVLGLRQPSDTQFRAQLDQSGVYWGPGGSTGPDTSITRQAANDLLTNASLTPTTTNARDLGTTAVRWRKLWVQDIDISGTQTGGGGGGLSEAQGDARYVQLTGGTITGDLIVSEATPSVRLKQAADTWPRLWLDDTSVQFGPGGSTAPDSSIRRNAAEDLQVKGSLSPLSSPAYDLGTNALKWRKLYATDADFANAPTVAGAALSTLFLPLTGGTLTGGLLVSQATPTLVLKQPADTQPRVLLDQTSISWGPGGSTAPDNQLSRNAANDMRSNYTLAPSTTNARDLGTTALRWRKLWSVDGEFTNAPTVGGAALSTLFLSLAAGGTVVGATTFNTRPTVAGVAQPRISVQSGAPSTPATGDLWIW